MRLVGIAAAGAILLALAYAVLVSPAFEPYLDDQVSYLRLAQGLVDRGEYTRGAVGAAFVPEPLRPPGYPLFLAPLCLFGCSHWVIAAAQALLYGALVALAYGIARRTLRPRAAVVATFAIALYLPIAYWATLAYSDFLSVFLLVASCAAFVRARRTGSLAWSAATGALVGWLALTRAVYILFPGALVFVALIVDGRALFTRDRLARVAALLVAFALVIAPLLVYSQRYFGRPFASSSGSAVWLGAVQGVGPSDLDAFEADELAKVKADVAAFDTITDRVDQAFAWITLNVSLGEHGARFIAHDVPGYLARTPLRAIVLWAGDLPVPVAASRTLGPVVRAVISGVQLALFVFGLAGAVLLARRRDDAALLPIIVIAYVSAVAIPLGTEARYALAAKPFVIIAAVACIATLTGRRTVRRALA